MTDTPDKIAFQLGTIAVTLDAMEVATRQQLATLLERHQSGDWGDLDPQDKKANEHALRHGERLFSKYDLTPDTELWVVTEWDRSVTTILTPDEY